jgi:hypothetical protein
MRHTVAVALLVVGALLPTAARAETCVSSTKPCDEPTVPAAVSRPLAGPAAPPPALGAPAPAMPRIDEGAPSLTGALLRLIGAVVTLALLMAGCVVGYRKLGERAGTRAMLAWVTGRTMEGEIDPVRVGSRRYLGNRESVAVIHAGAERFLVGITTANISLLARLDPASPASEPPVADFTEALTRAATPPAPLVEAAEPPDRALHAAVERSRERLARLAHLTVIETRASDGGAPAPRRPAARHDTVPRDGRG